MGREIQAIGDRDGSVAIVAGIVRPGTPVTERGGIPIVTSIAQLPVEVDVLIDFSTAEAAVGNARAAAERSLPIVIGTTGISETDIAQLRGLAASIAIWYARNMSYGVSVVHDVLRRIAAELRDYDVEIVEVHHRNKVDAPSGTALALAETIQRARREGDITSGRTGSGRRGDGEIGVQSLRGGGNVGEHTVIFASDDEEIRIGHRALSRSAFASGAIRAAKRIATATPGWYSADG
jgi:4-hydroxy-tetrahydrodipicolinate reductase